MKKIIENIGMLQIASLNASKKALAYLQDELKNQFDLTEDKNGLIYIDQNCCSLCNVIYALSSTNSLANYALATLNFFQTLEANKTYICISQAYTLYLLKVLEKHQIISLNDYFKTESYSLNFQRKNFGLEDRKKNNNMYHINFTKIRDVTNKDIIWIKIVLKSLNLEINDITFDDKNKKVKIIIKNDFKITIENTKKLLIILKSFLSELKDTSYDTYETSVHYYQLLKKCQIMMK